jgi:hypothetical protein
MEFQEKYKINIALFDATGSTTEKISDYYDMLDTKRIDFLVESKVLPLSSVGADDHQQITVRLLQSSDSTGGGASAISSATALVGKNLTTGISTVAKMKEAWLRFSTMNSDTALHVVMNGASYISATSGSAAHYFAAGASLAATVASEGFVAMFNSTVNNTATAITENFVASTQAGNALVRIAPKNPDSTRDIAISAGGTLISVGGVFAAHIGLDQQFMGEGKRYVAIGVKTTSDPSPFVVTAFREVINAPAQLNIQQSKSMNQSTSK